jgi:outer membrane receptor protein involved in Fe transport
MEPLSYANIIVNNGSKGTSTDDKGEYSLNLPSGSYQLLFSYIGYKTEIVNIELNTNPISFDINLMATPMMLQEVTVYSSSIPDADKVSSTSLQNKQIEQVSSVFPDMFRSIQALPGIAVNNEFSAKFNVRGGNYDENLVLVNNAQVYEPFHIKEAENASVGIFNIDLMKRVNLITGGFSAQYGDRLSSVLNIEYREGNKERFAGSTTMSMTNLDGTLEGPFLARGSFILGIRKSYMEYILKVIGYDEPVNPSFYDVQGVVSYDLTDRNKLQLKFIHAGDDFDYLPGIETEGPFPNSSILENGQQLNSVTNIKNFEENRANYYSNLFDVQHTLFISTKAFINSSLSYYNQIDKENYYYHELYNFDFTVTPNQNIKYFYYSDYEETYHNRLTINTWEAKSSLDLRLNPFYDFKTGMNYLNINYRQDFVDQDIMLAEQNYERYPDTVDVIYNENNNNLPQHIDANAYKFAAYIENIIQLGDRFIFNLGTRMDYFDINRDLTFSPRINASYKLGSDINLRAAWGFYYQSPIYRQLAYSFASDTNTQSQKAVHYILSIEKNFLERNNKSLTVKAEGYYKKYSDLIFSERDPGSQLHYSRKNDSKGYARGIDLYITLKMPRYYGWLSYGLLVAKENFLYDAYGEFPRYTDQRHTISIVNDFDLGKNWDMNLRLNYGSGFAYTPYYTRYNEESRRYEWVPGEKNSAYLPAYKRVDIRFGKDLVLFGLSAHAFLDVSNLFNFKNIMSYRYWYDSNGNPEREENELWPIVPSLGVTMKF